MTKYKKCPAGQYCEEGLVSVDDSRDCRRGYYCPEATPVELECPTGTWNPDLRKENITDCRPCTAGYVKVEYTILLKLAVFLSV